MQLWDNVEEFNEKEEAQVKTKLKVIRCAFTLEQSEEEIARHTLDENLSDTERILCVLHAGSAEQRLAVIQI